MADNYTPTTDAVANAFAQTSVWLPVAGYAPLKEAFDRWLAAHDAEKRAEWEAEQSRADAVTSMSAYDDGHTAGFAEGRAAALAEQGEPEWEYGTRRSVTDGWERGDRYGEHEYVDARSVSDRVGSDRSTVTGVRDMTRAVRRRKAGPWEPVTNTESEKP